MTVWLSGTGTWHDSFNSAIFASVVQGSNVHSDWQSPGSLALEPWPGRLSVSVSALMQQSGGPMIRFPAAQRDRSESQHG